jgi:hypothetical protein
MLILKFKPNPNVSDQVNERNRAKQGERFVKIAQAYDVLGDEKKRRVYDKFGMEGLDLLAKGHDPEQNGGFGGFGGAGSNGGYSNFNEADAVKMFQKMVSLNDCLTALRPLFMLLSPDLQHNILFNIFSLRTAEWEDSIWAGWVDLKKCLAEEFQTWVASLEASFPIWVAFPEVDLLDVRGELRDKGMTDRDKRNPRRYRLPLRRMMNQE